MAAQTFQIPFPPSVNQLYRNTTTQERSRAAAMGKSPRPRVKTDNYRAWINAAGWDIQIARPQRMVGQVMIEIVAGRPDGRRRDVSNLIKSVEDLMVKHQVIEDDSLVKRIAVEWGDVTGCRITVTEVMK